MSRRRERSEFQGQRVLLVGLGVHGGGAATARWLVRQGAIVRITDLKTRHDLAETVTALEDLGISWRLGEHAMDDFRWAQRIVVNPGVSPTLPGVLWAERHGRPVENEATLFVRHFPGRLIGVTGTRGKTTTTLLLGAIVRAAHQPSIVSGNVRQVAMLDYLPRTSSATWAVLELSSYQLERLPVVGRSFAVGVMTNVKRDHINRHGTIAKYGAIKRRLFSGQTTTDAAVLNADDPICRRVSKTTKARIWWYAPKLQQHQSGVTVVGRWVVEQANGKRRRLFPIADWRLPGTHNIYNLLAATAAARALAIPPGTIRRVITDFRGVPHRQEQLGRHGGHLFVNDTAATSPDGTLAALEVYPAAVFIVGGTDKDLDFRPLARAFVRKNVPLVLLPGSATEKLVTELHRLHIRQPIVRVHSMRAAVTTAKKIAQLGQAIVLSPGAASFGLFRHEFDRGEQFRDIVCSTS